MAKQVKYNFDDMPDVLYEKGLFSRENEYYFMITKEQEVPMILAMCFASIAIVMLVFLYGDKCLGEKIVCCHRRSLLTMTNQIKDNKVQVRPN